MTWGQDLLLLTKLKTREERVWYMHDLAHRYCRISAATAEDLAKYVSGIEQIEAELQGDN